MLRQLRDLIDLFALSGRVTNPVRDGLNVSRVVWQSYELCARWLKRFSRCLAELRTLCEMLKRFSRCLAELRTLCEMLKRFSRWQLMLSVAAHAASILPLDVTRARSTEAYYSCVLRPSSSSWILHTHRVVHPPTGRHTSEVR